MIPRRRSVLLLTFVVLTFKKQSNALSPLNRREAMIAGTNTMVIGSSPPQIQPSSVLLEDSIEFPLVSFGLQIYDDKTAYKLTLTALEVGYRNFFASVLARNQKGFARAVRDSGIPREKLFICGSVVSNRARGYDDAKRATTQGWEANLQAFREGNIEYLDQIMLDYPGPDTNSIRGQWKALEEMRDAKLVRTLAVSNFNGAQLDAIYQDPNAQYRPVVNQLPYSIAYHPPTNLQHGILVQAWAPLGGSLGGRFTPRMRDECAAVGRKYNKSGYQVALRWVLQKGVAVCTQTTQREHFVEDLDLFDFALDAQDMERLEGLAG